MTIMSVLFKIIYLFYFILFFTIQDIGQVSTSALLLFVTHVRFTSVLFDQYLRRWCTMTLQGLTPIRHPHPDFQFFSNVNRKCYCII